MDYHNKIYNMDCLAGMGMLPDACIDMVLTDLPYGTTDGDWDIMLPLPELWQQLYRVAKPRAAMVFTAAQPFTTQLISSNRKHFRYCWYWHKNQVTGFPFAKYQPLRCVEDIVVFYRQAPVYNPQGLVALEKPSNPKAGDILQLAYTERVAWKKTACRSIQTIPGRYSPFPVNGRACIPRKSLSLYSSI